jgi:hypothetical protein
MKRRRVLNLGWLVFGVALLVRAEPKSGDIFREFVWRPGDGKWQRITSPAATHKGAQKFLPNTVNAIELKGLEQATRVEVQFELLLSHFGTTGQAVRVNGGEWLPIPGPRDIPGKAGREPAPAEMFHTMLYPSVDVPVAELKNGKNSFEFTCRPGGGLAERWPQSIVYAAIFRIYYEPGVAGPSGRVVANPGTPDRFGTIGLSVHPVASGRTIRRVNFLARFYGYDWRGEGVKEGWHYQTHFGALRSHAGTAFMAPWTTAWDVREVPAQEAPVQIVARIEDDQGMCCISPPLALEKFRGMPNTRLIPAHDIPVHWQSRDNKRHACKITLPEDLSGLAEAKLILATWNGAQSDQIALNGSTLARNLGHNHDLSYDVIHVPISLLRPGENEFHTKSATLEHGIEVLWPGPVLLVRFAAADAAH